MGEQLSLLPIDPGPVVKGGERFAECRQGVEGGCGGHHESGPLLAGFPIARWVCCADCPVRSEVASSRDGED